MEESKEDEFKWVCPKCGTVFYGWAKNTCLCPKCGYREEDIDK
ncbi:MAG: hypothetical protein ACE5IH_05325 [Thermodesulfobacteriota bacterium]